MPKHRTRAIRLGFWVTPEEKELIHQKMAKLGTGNMSAYLRKMAIDGYAVNLDIPELREMTSLLRYSSNNLNQLAKRANSSGHGSALCPSADAVSSLPLSGGGRYNSAR